MKIWTKELLISLPTIATVESGHSLLSFLPLAIYGLPIHPTKELVDVWPTGNLV